MSDEQIEAFWHRAVTKARINPFEVVTGPDRDSSLTPPAWSLEDDAVEQALESRKLILTSATTEHEMLPRAGGLAILLWADNTPAALLQTYEVTVHSAEEMEVLDEVGDWARIRSSVRPGSDVVIERFRVLTDNA